MITLAFRFPGGRYHATPWGHQVNEGLVEWPPCPWRLLRAFISAGYTRLGWGAVDNNGVAAVMPPEARALLEQLAVAPPAYFLPPASVAHSRHYMPIPGGKPKLVLDVWVEVAGELVVQWPVTLDNCQRALLGALVGALNYLGRSESWIDGRLLAEETRPPVLNCMPLAADASGEVSASAELIDLLSPLPAAEYAAWQTTQAVPQDTSGKKATAKQLKDQARKAAPFPADLLDALQWDTARWKTFGWSQPPGSRMIQYRRPREALQTVSTAAATQSAAAPLCDLVLLALATASGNMSSLPMVSRTLPQGELLHKALVGRAGEGAGIPSVLSGCDDQRHPLKGHAHTHVLPVDLDDDGRIDHILLWAPMGFGSEALRAIRAVRRTWMKGGAGELRLAVAGMSTRSELARSPDVSITGVGRLIGTAGGAKEWVSVTPFVPPRHLKRTGRNTLEGQVQAELASRGLPAARSVSLLERDDPTWRRLRSFVRVRARGGTPPPVDVGLAIRITFAESVSGPLCLGYANHFGLGLFAAVTAKH